MPPCTTNEKYTSSLSVCVCTRTYVFERCFVSVVVFLSRVSGRHLFRCFGRRRRAKQWQFSFLCAPCTSCVYMCTFTATGAADARRCKSCCCCWWIIFIFNYPVVCVCRADWALFNQHTRRSMLFCRPCSFPISPDVESPRRAESARVHRPSARQHFECPREILFLAHIFPAVHEFFDHVLRFCVCWSLPGNTLCYKSHGISPKEFGVPYILLMKLNLS